MEQDVVQDLSTDSTETDHSQTSQDQSNNESSELTPSEEQALVTELEKLDKFKFQGQELTAKDLEKMILRQKDYTQKTQGLAEERKAIETEKQERKFYENLYYDLQSVKSNPQLIQEFIKTYPEKFHGYLKEVLKESSPTQGLQQQQEQKPQYDIDQMSRIQKLENFYNQQQEMIQQQEVAKTETAINQKIDELSKKYPDALPELAIGKVFEVYNKLQATGGKLSDADWESAFKSSDEQIKNLVKSRYGEMVKKQTQANAKARDVDSGGGTVGRAPHKFSSLKEVTDFAINDLTRR